MRPPKLAVWDVDGTLVDSRASILRAAVEAAQAINVDPPVYDQVRMIVGLSLSEALAQMRSDLAPDVIRAYTHEYQQAFLRFHAEPGFHDALYPGANDCLRRLKSEGWKLGMATGQSRRGVNRCLTVYNWSDVFDVAFCADDGPSKPDPTMLNANMTALGVPASQTVMIGDTAHDITMARHAGATAIAVSWGFHTLDELSAAKPHYMVHDYAELEQVLREIA